MSGGEPVQAVGQTTRYSSALLGVSELNPVHAEVDYRLPPLGPRYDMHFGLELGLVLSGRMKRHYSSRHMELNAGQIWLCGMWERHGWEAVAGPCARLVIVMLPRALHEARLKNLPELDWLAPFRVRPQDRPQIRGRKCSEALAIARRFERAMAGGASPARSLITALELLLLLLGDWRSPSRQPPVEGSWYQAAERAVDFALSSRGLVTTREAAAACAMSERAFRRAFEALMGISFPKFVLRYRLSEAARQLLETEEPIKRIAAACGFKHASHFSHSFRRHYRVSPAAYRESGR